MAAERPHAPSELDQLIYVLSHDLRAPARALRQYVILLREEAGGQVSETAERFLGRMDQVLDRLDDRLDALLELSRAANPSGPAEPVDLGALVMAALAEREVAGEVASWLPRVFADAPRLTRVAAELAANVAHHAGPGARVTFSFRDGRFWFRDTGRGVPEAALREVFTVFRPVPLPESGRRGMGLCFVQRIARSLGGEAGLESRPGHGTGVWLEVPLAR